MLWRIQALLLFLAASAGFAAPAPKNSWEQNGWGRPIDPDRDCKSDLKDGTITVEMPGGDHELDPARKRFNAPLILRQVEGDFVMQVRVCASFLPSVKSSVKGEDSRVAAGLVLIPAEKNYIRLEYGAYRRKGEQCNLPFFLMRGKQIWNIYTDWHLPWKPQIGKENEESLYLRLDRRGQEIFRLLSPDGKGWGVGSVSVKIPDLPTKLRVGLAAFSTSSEPSKVRFDQFKLIQGQEEKK